MTQTGFGLLNYDNSLSLSLRFYDVPLQICLVCDQLKT